MTAAETTPRTPRRLARLLLVAFSLAVSLGIAEVAVRVVRPQAVMTVSRGLYEPDPPRRYRLRPGFRGRVGNQAEYDTAVSIDRLGMRGGEVGPKAPGAIRILALGDSFTFGVGAREEQTWPARLQESLRALGLPVEVLNAGAPGFGIPDEVAWFERYGRELRPDLVIVAAFLANDLQDASPDQPKVQVVDGALVVPGETGGLRRWLYYHSHLFRLFKSSVLEGPLRSRLGLREPWAVRELRSEQALYSEHPPAELMRGAEATDRAVAELARAGVPAVAVLIPSLPQVDPRKWHAVLQQLGFAAADAARLDPRRPNRLFESIFARHGLPVLDLAPGFAAEIRQGRSLYYPVDQHLTPEGYDRMARAVAGFLLEQGLVRAAPPRRPETAPAASARPSASPR